MPFTSLLDLKLPVHPIPTKLYAFVAGSAPNSQGHAIYMHAYNLVLINTFITILDTVLNQEVYKCVFEHTPFVGCAASSIYIEA